jgi:hypothetical protein
MRQLLKRVSGLVNEYEIVQSNVAQLSDRLPQWLPPEVVDAFSHDPAAVSGTSRRLRGWKAVEDINRRIQRQRETLTVFAQCNMDGQPTLPHGGLFGSSSEALVALLKTLESERDDIMSKAQDVAKLLSGVKKLHQPTKRDYNETLAHVSVVYPEVGTCVIISYLC